VAGQAIPFSFKDSLTPSRIACEGRRCCIGELAATDQRSNERHDCAGLSFGDARTGRHSGIRHTGADDTHDVFVGLRRLERPLTEINAGNPVAILAVATAATRIVDLAAGIDLLPGVAVLLGGNRGSNRKNDPQHQNKNPSWPHGSRLSVNVTSPENPKS
jgi:hypothetical protein